MADDETTDDETTDDELEEDPEPAPVKKKRTVPVLVDMHETNSLLTEIRDGFRDLNTRLTKVEKKEKKENDETKDPDESPDPAGPEPKKKKGFRLWRVI